MKMVRHYDELVDKKFLFTAIVENGVDEQLGYAVALEERTPSPCTRGDEINV